MIEQDKSENVPTLREQIEIDKRQRSELFAQRFQALCDELQCDLKAIPRFTEDGRVTVQFAVEAR
jgi:hypothetical protein